MNSIRRWTRTKREIPRVAIWIRSKAGGRFSQLRIRRGRSRWGFRGRPTQPRSRRDRHPRCRDSKWTTSPIDLWQVADTPLDKHSRLSSHLIKHSLKVQSKKGTKVRASSSRRRCLSLEMTFWLSMLTDSCVNSSLWATRTFCKTNGKKPLKSSLPTTSGTPKTEERSKDQPLASTTDSKADCMRCKRDEGDWSSTSTRKRENSMSLKKASTRVLAKRVRLLRSLVRFSWKTYWEHPPRTWHKRLFQASFRHREVLVF